MKNLEHLLFLTLIQIVIIIAAARVTGHLARRIGQPRAVGEILAGILLGPSLFGALAPETFAGIFRATDNTAISIMSQIGLIMLMFQIGLEFDFSHLKTGRNRLAVVLVSLFGIALPFLLGLGFGWLSAPRLAPEIDGFAYPLFLAVAFSITAVPILGRIMIEFDLTRTLLGAVTIAAAAVNDAIGWTLLAVVAAVVTAHFSWLDVLARLGWLFLYVMACWLVVRQVLRYILQRFDLNGQGLPQDLMAVLLIIVFSSALLTSQLGIFAIFGGFMVGVLLHDQRELVAAWRDRVADLVTVFFLPIFFTYTGLRTDIGSLESGELWLWCGALVSLATLGKFGGCYAAARLSGLGRAESRAIAILMNTRALMELVVVNLGYDLGVIPPSVFTMLVLMALISTVMTAPALRRWLPATGHVIPKRRDA